MIVDSHDVSRWFGEYLDAFAACGRGESDAASLLAYYGVPLLVTLAVDHALDMSARLDGPGRPERSLYSASEQGDGGSRARGGAR